MIANYLVDLALFVAITLLFLKAKDFAANYPKVNWQFISILTIGLMTSLSLLHSHKIGNVYFDLRSVPIFLFSYMAGWKAGLAASLMPILFRLSLGGEYALAAVIITLILPVFFGNLFHNKIERSEYKLLQMVDVLISANLFFLTEWIGKMLVTDLPFYQLLEITTYKALLGNAAVIGLIWIYNDSSRNRLIKREYEKLSNYDAKTGLPNIRYFHEKAAALATNRPLFLLMIDIDHFKHYNDANGHIIGDGLLTHFGSVIKHSIGVHGFVARYGGEEFVAALPVDSKETACAIADWLRTDIEQTHFSGSEKQPYGKITASIGISGPHNDLSTLIQQAEESVMVAKHQGKNRYCYYYDIAPFVDRAMLEQERDFFKNHYESLLESSGDGICGLDSKGTITFANPAAVRLTGYRQEELVGKDIGILFSRHPSADTGKSNCASCPDCPIRQTLLDGVLRHQLEAPLNRMNKLPLTVEYLCSPIAGRERVLGGVVTFIDITERKKLQELARKADRMDVIGNTAEGIAHEIRNPLTTLKGFLQLSRYKLDPIHYETMRRELEQIEFVVRELLVVSKPYELQLQEIDFRQCVQQSVELAKAQAFLQNTQIDFEHNGPLPAPAVLGDAKRLEQLVLHLIRNALDSLEEGGNVTVSLTVEAGDVAGDVASPGDPSILLTIRDNGKGVPEDIVRKLGEPFYSTKTNGIGLGLTLCNQIVQQHKGEMQIESAMNQGTTVLVKLPFSVPSVQPQLVAAT